MKIFTFLLMIPIHIILFLLKMMSDNESYETHEYESHRENQIDVKTGDVISVETKRVGL